MALQISHDNENKLLRRREIQCLFPKAVQIARGDAVKAMAQTLNVDPAMVHLISLMHLTGTRDVEGHFYIYPKLEDAKEHIPPYFFTRMLSKEERKKVKEAARKPPAGAKPAAAKPAAAKPAAAKSDVAPKE